MQAWSELFSLFDLQVGQLLFTLENFSDRNINRSKRPWSAFGTIKLFPSLMKMIALQRLKQALAITIIWLHWLQNQLGLTP